MGGKVIRQVMIFAALAGASAAGKTSATSLQQEFDLATKLFESERWSEAARAYSMLRERLTHAPSGAGAVASLREGYALFRLDRRDEALERLEAGLAGISNSPSLASDRALGNGALAIIYEAQLQYALAQRHYERALIDTGPAADKVGLITGLARTAMFDSPDDALSALNRALSMVPPNSEADRRTRATILTLRGRAHLNAGRFAPATDDLTKATDLLGGLTRRVDAADLTARSDLGIAALLAGDEEAAHRYLAYTGAGQSNMGGLPKPKAANFFDCFDEYTPEDKVIVEFGIDNEGNPVGPHPIYASKPGRLATDAAGLIGTWRWSPVSIKDMSPLLRSVVRVELHCMSPLFDDVDTYSNTPRWVWLAKEGVTRFKTDRRTSYRAGLDILRRALADREASGEPESIQILPLLDALASHVLVSASETIELRKRELAVARAAKAPAAAIAEYELILAYAESAAAPRQVRLDRVRSLLRDPSLAGDSHATAFLKYNLSRLLSSQNQRDEAERLLREVADDTSLPPTDRERVVANRFLFELARNRQDYSGARGYLAQAQSAVGPCGVAQVTARPQNNSSAFPNHALRWGFEGWAATQFDLSSRGLPQEAKLLAAYPPLVFSDAARRVIATQRFRIDNAATATGGCVGQSEWLTFLLR